MNKGETVTVIDLEKNEQKEFETKNIIYRSHVSGDYLYSTDQVNIYQYSIKDFSLNYKRALEKVDGMVVVDLFTVGYTNSPVK